MPLDSLLAPLRSKVVTYGKENQGELLYALTEGAQLLSGNDRVRIYLEDLTRGALSCVHTTGPYEKELREITFPIVSDETVVSSVFISQYPADFRIASGTNSAQDNDFAKRFGFRYSYIMSIVSQGKSIGVLCIDQELRGEVLNAQAAAQLADFAGFIANRLDQARIYHQQVQLARRLEEFKSREAAAMMVKSAVHLVKKVSLASVLVLDQSDPSASSLGILASYSDNPQLKKLYDQLG